jgi:hypothetical protein
VAVVAVRQLVQVVAGVLEDFLLVGLLFLTLIQSV